MAAPFNGNSSTTIISCNSPTNAMNKKDLDTFNNEASSLVRSIPKQRALIIGGDKNAQISKNVNLVYRTCPTEMKNTI